MCRLPKKTEGLPLHGLEQLLIRQCRELRRPQVAVFHDVGPVAASAAGAAPSVRSFFAVGSMIKCNTLENTW